MRLLDLTGKVYNRLTVESYVGNSKWKCRCSCGNIREIIGYRLTHSSTKSCGCIRLGTRTKNLIGKIFGELKPIKITYTTERGIERKAKWECQCSCGNICYVLSSDLLKGHTKSCGCKGSRMKLGRKNFKNIVGNKFGILTAVKEVGSNKEGRTKWLCKCGCGRTTTVLGKLLRSGHTKSCGICRWPGQQSFILTLNEHFKNILCFEQQARPKYLNGHTHDGYNDDFKIAVEYNGEQHYRSVPWFGGVRKFKLTQKLDRRKRLYCKQQKVALFEFRAEQDDIDAFIYDIEEYLVRVCDLPIEI